MLSTAEKIAKARELKMEGNSLFKSGDLKKAVVKYRTVFAFVNGLVSEGDSMAQYGKVDVDGEEKQEIAQLKKEVYSNLAMAYLRLEKPDKALQVCDKAIEIDANDSKLFFRKGLAYMAVAEFEKSKECLLISAKLDPRNKAIRSAIEEWKTKYAKWKKEQNEKDKSIYGGSFEK